MEKQNIFKSLQSAFLNLNPYEFTLLAALIGFLLCEGLNYNQQQTIGNFFEMVGQTTLTVGAQNQNISEGVSPDTTMDYTSIIDILKNKIDNLEEIVAEIKNMKL